MAASPRSVNLPGLLAAGAERLLRDSNPWWRGERQFGVPAMKRWAFRPTVYGLREGLAPVTVLRGPRQVGKTTLVNQVIDALLDDGVAPQRIFRVQFDDLPQLQRLETPILDLAAWFADHVLGQSINAFAHTQGGPVYLLLDEVQNLRDWATQVKHLVDLQPVRAIVTGSSALRIEAGRDSLAGRLSTIEMGPLLLREIAQWRGLGDIAPYLPFNGIAPLRDKAFWQGLRAFGEQHRTLRDAAFAAFSERGAYPLAHSRVDASNEEVAEQLVETVVRRAIQHDLRVGERGRRRDEALVIPDHWIRTAWLQRPLTLVPSALDAAPHLADAAEDVARSVAGQFFRSMCQRQPNFPQMWQFKSPHPLGKVGRRGHAPDRP